VGLILGGKALILNCVARIRYKSGDVIITIEIKMRRRVYDFVEFFLEFNRVVLITDI
jgi:hypothetical protein